jgi:hypothetical protein
MYFIKLRALPIGAEAALEPRANIAACFVNTESAVIAITRVRARLRAADWDAGEVLEIRQVRRSSCMEDPEMLQHFDLALTAGISIRLYTWSFVWPTVARAHEQRAV